MPLIDDPRFSRNAIVGPVRQDLMAADALEPEEAAPGVLDVLAVGARQATLAGGAYERLVNADPDLPDAPPEFDPFDHIEGYEDISERFVDADTPSEVAGIKARRASELADRDVLRRAGLGGPIAELTMTLFDPTFLVAAAVPELAIAKAGRLGRAGMAAIRGAAGATAYEGGMQLVQEGRTLQESGINIGAGALLGGILGTLGRRMPAEELERARSSTREIADAPHAPRSEVGAASAAPRTTLEQESIARGGATLSRLAGKVPLAETDLQVVMRSESIAARQVLQDLADVSPILAKNVEGIATPTSVEALVARHEGRVAAFSEELRRLYAAHRRSPDATLVGTPALSRRDFYAAVAAAARRGDRDIFPHVREAARFLREQVFDPLKLQAQRLGLLPKDVEVVGAESYFRRMYDREAIRRERAEWDSILTNHFFRKGVEFAEARSIAEDITRRILGADVGVANFNVRTNIPHAGPLHERVLDIPDEMIERFLISDPLKVAGAYVRELAPQLEITRRFGDKNMADAFDRIRHEYDVLRERARGGFFGKRTSPELTRLTQQERTTLEALQRIRDRVYGRAGRIPVDASSRERRVVSALRGWRNFVAAGKLGGTAVTGGTMDLARIVAQYGFAPTIAKLTKLATSSAFRELSKVQARRLGAAVEVALARRVSIAAEGAITEGWTQKLANGVYRVSGLNHITDFWRTLTATLLEDRVLEAAADLAAGRALAPFARTRLAALGLDEDALRRIHVEVARHGADVDGVRVSGSADWTDTALAEAYEAAVLKESRIVVMQPGAADRVWWMDSETGKVVGQLKSFALASIPRMSLTPAQLLGQRQYLHAARFAGAMMIGGYLTHALRQLIAGREPNTDPAQALAEAYSESGLAGVLPDLISPFARRFGVLDESARYSDRNVLGAFGGPALGTIADVYELAYNRTANGMSAADLRLLRRVLPYQNLWWMRRAINALEGETAEAFDLQGAEAASFGERFLETKPLLPSSERGGTGTGRIAY